MAKADHSKKKKEQVIKVAKSQAPAFLIFAFLLVLTLFVLPVAILKIAFAEAVQPGTTIAGLQMDYKTPSEIGVILKEKIHAFEKEKITVYTDGGAKSFSPQDLGISFNSEKILAFLPIVQIKNQSLAKTFFSFLEETIVPLDVSIDDDTMKKTLQTAFISPEDIPVESTLFIDPKGKMQVQEGKSGKMLGFDDIKKHLLSQSQQFSTAPIKAEIAVVNPLFSRAELEEFQKSFSEDVKKPYLMTGDEQTFKLPLLDHLDWVSFGTNANIDWENASIQKKIVVKLAPEKIQAFLAEEVAKKIDIPMEGVKISRDEKGGVSFEGRGQDGKSVDMEKLASALVFSVNERLHKIEIPIQELKAPIDVASGLQDLGIKELISVGHTSFYGSPANRIHNIKVGIVKYNGVIIPPGEKFSFNKILGTVDGSTGYLPELVIKPEGTIPEFGGGLCQVSTTAYRAALYAGVPILARNPHSYAVAYYAQIGGHGIDATIYPGASDLVFQNDTPGSILIQAYADGMHAYFKFYGTQDSRVIKMEGPYISNQKSSAETVFVETSELPPGKQKQVENGHTGFDALWYRYITKDGKTEKESIISKYRIVPKKVLVGTDAAAPGAAPAPIAPAFSD